MTLLLGLGVAWLVEAFEGEPCPVCSGRKLGLTACCLVCNRSGVDHLIGPPPRMVRINKPRAKTVASIEEAKAAARQSPKRPVLDGGIGRRPSQKRTSGKGGRAFDLAAL